MLRRSTAVFVLLAAGLPATAYIHFPPMTLPKMCKESLFVRVLTVAKADAESGVVVFDLDKTLKTSGGYTAVPFARHLFHTDPKAAKPFLEKLAVGKRAVMFAIENAKVGCAYVFVDGDCYTADYSQDAKGWLFLRAEPQMVKCYKGTVADLLPLVADVLAGKDAKVPTGEAKFDKDDWQKRFDEINAFWDKYRKK